MISRKLKRAGSWLKENFGGLLALAGILSMLGGFVSLIVYNVQDSRANERSRRTYCGTVTERYRYDATKGHSAEAHIVYRCPALGRNIDVEVSNNTYANAEPGSQICFTLTDRDLRR